MNTARALDMEDTAKKYYDYYSTMANDTLAFFRSFLELRRKYLQGDSNFGGAMEDTHDIMNQLLDKWMDAGILNKG